MVGGVAPTAGRVDVRRDGPVERWTLDNPGRRNALTWDMYDRLARACEAARTDPDLRLVVIRGAGGAFAAGTDIAQFTGFDGTAGVAYEHKLGPILDGVAALPVPVLAVVDGPAVGAGLALAACADIVVASEESRFGVPIARTLGNCLPPRVLARLRGRLGPARTMAMLLTASLLSAREAAAAGLVFAVAARADLPALAADVERRICAGAPLTLAGLKEIERRLDAGRTDADDVLYDCYDSADFAEGVRAFLAHRDPVWTGR